MGEVASVLWVWLVIRWILVAIAIVALLLAFLHWDYWPKAERLVRRAERGRRQEEKANRRAWLEWREEKRGQLIYRIKEAAAAGRKSTALALENLGDDDIELLTGELDRRGYEWEIEESYTLTGNRRLVVRW